MTLHLGGVLYWCLARFLWIFHPLLPSRALLTNGTPGQFQKLAEGHLIELLGAPGVLSPSLPGHTLDTISALVNSVDVTTSANHPRRGRGQEKGGLTLYYQNVRSVNNNSVTYV